MSPIATASDGTRICRIVSAGTGVEQHLVTVLITPGDRDA